MKNYFARSAWTCATLLGLSLALGIVAAASADEPSDKDALAVAKAAEKEATDALRGVASNIQYHRTNGRVQFIRFSKSMVTDEHLAQLEPCTDMTYLAVVSPNVTDAGAAHVAGLVNLDTLVLSGTQVTDAAMSHLAGLAKLEQLYLDDTAITDQALDAIAKLPTLRVLSLRNTMVTDAGLEKLSPLAGLVALHLEGTSISDAGLAHLTKLPELKALYLAETKVSGNTFAELATLEKLEHLTLDHTPVSDDAAVALGGLKHLKQILLYRTKITPAGVSQLREKLPKALVYVDPQAEPRLQVKKNDPDKVAQAGAIQAEGDVLAPIESRLAGEQVSPDFQRHVIPLLGRLGCNGRACHGSFQGQGGFRLSMFGYDFDLDHTNLTGGDDPRVDVKQPLDSLILNKPTSEDEHGGGLRLHRGSWEFDLLHAWIKQGAQSRPQDAATMLGLTVEPSEIEFGQAGQEVNLRVIASWSDGTREDVTCLTRFVSNDDSVASVDGDGKVTSKGPGDTYVVAFYDNGIASIEVVQPVSNLVGERFPQVPTPTKIDELVVAKLRRLGIEPSPLCTDEEFLRRVSIDITGSLPTPAEIKEFLADESPDKRDRKIDELLERPTYVAWWSVKLCDLTGSNVGYLGSTEMAKLTSEQWEAWIRRRVQDNVGWDKIAADIVLARSRQPGERYEEYIARQSSFARTVDPADITDPGNQLPHYWFRSNMTTPEEMALAFGYTFLGVRLDCAQCHKHPFDQWSQQDFQQFTQFFTRISRGVAPDAKPVSDQLNEMLGVPEKLNTAALRRQMYMRVAAEGKLIPWREVYIAEPKNAKDGTLAKVLGGDMVNLQQYADPRQPLAQWLLSENNPYFARAFVNRIWAHYFNVGIVQPPDDMNLANPPSNKPLLEYLERGFIESGYDMRWLHRTITRSRTYQLTWRPTETNRKDLKNFSHAIVRRLPAEVAVDAMHQTVAPDASLKAAHENLTGRQIAHHPRSYQARTLDYSLLIFGKPLRTTNCDCERQSDPTILQALYTRNDTEILALLNDSKGWLAEVAKAKPPADTEATEKLIEDTYLRVLSRHPSSSELADCREHFAGKEDHVDALRDLVWALLNTQEFITNH